MVSNTSNDIINLIKSLSLSERLKIVEEILRNIREEGLVNFTTERINRIKRQTKYGQISRTTNLSIPQNAGEI